METAKVIKGSVESAHQYICEARDCLLLIKRICDLPPEDDLEGGYYKSEKDPRALNAAVKGVVSSALESVNAVLEENLLLFLEDETDDVDLAVQEKARKYDQIHGETEQPSSEG